MEDVFRSIFLQLHGKVSGLWKQQEQQLFVDYLGKINSELHFIQLELLACINQYNGHVYYGIVNKVSDDQSKLGTKYTVPQIAFFKGIVEAIIQDAEAKGCIFYSDAMLNIQLKTKDYGAAEGGAVQMPWAFKRFSMPQKAKAIDQLINDQWLCLTSGGDIGIGVRSFLDLRSWFRSDRVPSCVVCNEAAIKAQLRQNEACDVRLHLYCVKKKFSGKKVERVCPGCGSGWRGATIKEEEMNDQIVEPPRKRSRRLCGEANTEGAGDANVNGDKSESRRVTRSARLMSSSNFTHFI